MGGPRKEVFVALDLFAQIRRSRVFRFVLGGSALSLAVGGTAAAASNALTREEQEAETVALDLEDGQVAVAIGEDVAEALDDADAGIAEETEPTPVTPATPPSPPSPDTPPTPDTPESPPSPPSPATPDTPDSPDEDSPDEDDEGEDEDDD